ncbi:MAG: ATP-binding protein [Acidobacteria bacterium]|nr:ATP-binding protein [Acidobacteriota bacterium]
MVASELDARHTRYSRVRLQLAHLPFVKTFDRFDFSVQPSIDERQVRELRTLRFVHEASNVILLGPTGVGKTHLSVALAEAAVQAALGAQGDQSKVGFRPGRDRILRSGPHVRL